MGISSSYAKVFDDHPFWTTIFTVWAATKVIRAVGQAAGTYKGYSGPMIEITTPSMKGLGHGGGGHGGHGHWGGGGWGGGWGWGGPEYIPYPVVVPVGVVEGGVIPDEVIAQETAGLSGAVGLDSGGIGMSWPSGPVNSMNLHATPGHGRRVLQAYGSTQSFNHMIQINPLAQQTEAVRISTVLDFMDRNSSDVAYDWISVPGGESYSRPYFRSVLMSLRGMLGDIAARHVAARQARGH